MNLRLNVLKPQSGLHLLKHFIDLAGALVLRWQNNWIYPQCCADIGVLACERKKISCRLAEDLGLSPLSLDELNLSNQADREDYMTGRCGYALLRLRKSATPLRWRPGEITEANHEQMLALFKSCFGMT